MRKLSGFVIYLLLAVSCRAVADPCTEATAALQRREFAQAEALLKQCIAAHPDQLLPHIQLCSIYQSQGRESDLQKAALEGMKKFPAEKRFYVTVGNRAGRDKRYQQAIEVFSEAVKRWPDDERMRHNLASAHLGLGMQLMEANKYGEAEAQLRSATKLSPDDVEAHWNLGRALHNLLRSDEAVREFDTVIKLDAQLARAHFDRGVVLYQLRDFGRAIEDFNREIEINPSYPPSYLFRGLARLDTADLDGAIQDLDMAVGRMPEVLRAHYARARCLQRLGRPGEAETEFRTAMGLDPSDPAPVGALARLLMQTGRKEEAEQLSQKAKELMTERRSETDHEMRSGPPEKPDPDRQNP
jgi:tetratricopeptide (TPR) repeat protein